MSEKVTPREAIASKNSTNSKESLWTSFNSIVCLKRYEIYENVCKEAHYIRLLFISLFLSPITLLRTDPQDVTLPPRYGGPCPKPFLQVLDILTISGQF